MAETAVNDAVEFTGLFEHGVDSSFRIMLPGAWRFDGKETTFYLVPWPLKAPDHLLALPPDRWRLAKERLREKFSLTSSVGTVVQRAFASSSVERKLDDNGRLCLGKESSSLTRPVWWAAWTSLKSGSRAASARRRN